MRDVGGFGLGSVLASGQADGTMQVVQTMPDTLDPVVAIGDTNNDGRKDVVTVDNDKISVYEQQLDGSLVLAGTTNLQTGLGNNASVLIADINGDGAADVLMCDVWGDMLVAMKRPNGTYEISENSNCASEFVGASNSFTVFDFNGDGHVDIVGGSKGLKGLNEARVPLDIYLGNVSNYSRPIPP
jgi:hypothetical protein